MKLYFSSGQYPGRVLEIKPEGMNIGRGPDNDLVLETEGISRHHCKLYQRQGKWYIEDLESTNGVHVNGRKISVPEPLSQGDRIDLYDQSLTFTDEAGLAVFAKGEGVEPGDSSYEQESSSVTGPPDIPWGHIILLVVLLVIVAWALISTFMPALDEDPGEAEISEPERTEIVEPPAGVELESELLQQEEEVDVEAGDELEEITEVDVVEPVDEQGVARDAVPAGQEKHTMIINSDPQGATVSINGNPAGTTPLVIEDISRGRHTVNLELAGYRSLTRQIYVPDTVLEEPYSLRLKAGVVHLMTTPRGATVFHGSQLLGQTPLIIEDLPTGDNEIRIATYGYKPHTETIRVDDFRGIEKHFNLESELGAVEILTLPAGCSIYVDNVFKGVTTQAPDVARKQSAPFRVEGLRAGIHGVRVEHPNGAEETKNAEVKPDTTSSIAFRLWVLDTRLVLRDGTLKHGMLVARNEFDDITISLFPDREVNTYLKDQIEEVETLAPREARDFLQQHQPDEG